MLALCATDKVCLCSPENLDLKKYIHNQQCWFGKVQRYSQLCACNSSQQSRKNLSEDHSG